MKQRPTMFLTVGLGLFMLVLAGSVAAGLAVKGIAPQTAASDTAVVQSGSGTEGTIVDARTTEPLAVPGAAGTLDATVRAKLILAERATRIALVLVPGGWLQRAPELVNYQGQMAYEVPVSGNLVYIDAFSGDVLGNVAPADSTLASQAGTPGNSESSSNETVTAQQFVTGIAEMFRAQPGRDRHDLDKQYNNDGNEYDDHDENNHANGDD